MALMPKRVKYRKSQRGKMKGNASRTNFVAFGEYGLQALARSWISAKQIEAGRVAATHFLHREGKVYLRIFPHKSVSAKPLETRMGKGKGEPAFWVARVRPGQMMFEIGGVNEDVAKRAMVRASNKMPIKCRFVKRRHSL
ncbi:MAG: 50S ribosomal protein L16 [Sedimentisphaerales bacterium]|nr:50S ribosomal protein L16 [Sedimentisphaerales bacterium]